MAVHIAMAVLWSALWVVLVRKNEGELRRALVPFFVASVLGLAGTVIGTINAFAMSTHEPGAFFFILSRSSTGSLRGALRPRASSA